MDCEVHEAYASEQGFMEHNQHIAEAQLKDLANKYGAELSVFSFLMGLEPPSAV